MQGLGPIPAVQIKSTKGLLKRAHSSQHYRHHSAQCYYGLTDNRHLCPPYVHACLTLSAHCSTALYVHNKCMFLASYDCVCGGNTYIGSHNMSTRQRSHTPHTHCQVRGKESLPRLLAQHPSIQAQRLARGWPYMYVFGLLVQGTCNST